MAECPKKSLCVRPDKKKTFAKTPVKNCQKPIDYDPIRTKIENFTFMEKFSLLCACAQNLRAKIKQNRKLYISGKVFTHLPMMN